MEAFYSWVKSIVVFLLLISMVYQMIPASAYKKYVSVCTGLMLMIVTVWPIVQWTGVAGKMSYFLGLENVKIDAMDFEQISQGAETQKEQLITRNYKTQLEKQVLSMLEGIDIYPVQAEISIVEDMGREDYGRIKTIHIVAVSDSKQLADALNSEGKTTAAVAPVEQVHVPEVSVLDEGVDANNDAHDTGIDNAAGNNAGHGKGTADGADNNAGHGEGADGEAGHNAVSDEAVKKAKERISDALYIDEEQISIDFR